MKPNPIMLRMSPRTLILWFTLAFMSVAQARLQAEELQRLPPLEQVNARTSDVGIQHRNAARHDEVPRPTVRKTEASALWPTRLASFEQVMREEPFSIDLGGYVKADLIHDFDSIGSTDTFDPVTIPTDGRPGENTRLHARQTRLHLDFQLGPDVEDLNLYAEGDFFGAGSNFRLRHAYIRTGRLLVGQTWSTFMDESILPSTLDFESPRSILLDRRTIFRFTQPVTPFLSVAFALEDPQPTLDLLVGPMGGVIERPAPDLISRVRYQTDRWHLQAAGLVRMIRFREALGARDDAAGWGFNFTGRCRVRARDSVLFQVAIGEGYESYRQGVDGAVDANGLIELNPALAWVVGYEVDWTDRLSSTIVYSVAEVTAASFQPASSAESIDYFAANLVFRPLPRLSYGIEYLFGSRTDRNFARGEAHRMQFSVRYDLP